MAMSTRDELEQQLGELIHGCLSVAEAERLCQRITSDPRAARAYAEAKQAADVALKNGEKNWCANKNACATGPATLSTCAAAGSKNTRGRLVIAALASSAALLLVGYLAFSPAAVARPDDGPLRLTTKLSATELHLGETAQLQVMLENLSSSSQPLTVVVVGLPSGLSPRYEQIDKLAAAGRFASYELREARDAEIAFYWRGVPATARGEHAIRFSFDVVAEQPGRSTGPASHAYLVYSSQKKHRAKPLTVEIVR